MTGYASSNSFTPAPDTGKGNTRYPAWLRTVLWIDGATGLASGAMQLAVPEFLGNLYGLPAALIQASAVVVLVFVALIAVLLARPQVPLLGLRTLVAGNALWVVGSVAVVELQFQTLTALGVAYVVLQAGFVGTLAYLQARAMRR